MFHPIDTGLFKLVVFRPTDSIKAHPQSRYPNRGGAYPTASNTQFSAAHRPLSTLKKHFRPCQRIVEPTSKRPFRMRVEPLV
jgi:hypothetical protein